MAQERTAEAEIDISSSSSTTTTIAGAGGIDRSLLQRIVGIFQAMDGQGQCYSKDLETPLLADTRDHFARQAQVWLEAHDTPTYLRKAEAALDAEFARVHAYLQPVPTRSLLLRVVVEELIEKPQMALLAKEASGCAALLAAEREEDLSRMFSLFRRVGMSDGGASLMTGNGMGGGEADGAEAARKAADLACTQGLTPMADVLQMYVEELGLAIIKETTEVVPTSSSSASTTTTTTKSTISAAPLPSTAAVNPSKLSNAQLESAAAAYIKALLAIHDKFRTLIDTRFESSYVFTKALKAAFTLVINKNVLGKTRTSGELLATFCHRLLRKGGKGDRMGDEEMDATLGNVVLLLGYLYDKDVFQEAYAYNLAKRLLNEKSSKEDWEKALISKLKGTQGPSYVNRMEKCINDLALSADTVRSFHSEADVASLPIPSFTARILTQGFWPSSTVGSRAGGSGSAMQSAGVGDDVFLPPIMRQCRDTFEAWYINTFQGRRLAWPHALGTVEIRATFPASNGSKTYDVNLATLQAVVLLAFHDSAAQSGGALVSLRALAIRVHLNISDLKSLVHSLACGNYKLLTKTPPGKHIRDGDQFAANPQFSCPKRVFALSIPSIERAQNPERVHENRKFVIDAAVVRIMKGRRQMTHHELVAETIAHIRLFKAQPVDVKKRIHSLIDTEYLERSGQSTYRYLA